MTAATPHPHRHRMLLLVSVAELLGMSLWFTASSVSPQLAGRWELSAQETGWLTGIVQLGFVGGTAVAAVLNLADLWPAHRLMAGSALLGALANAALLAAPDYGVALGCRFATGFFLAGVYPPAMKMIATWFERGRGLAIGSVVGALTLGKATPYLVSAVGGADVAVVVLTASAAALLASALVTFGYREGPFPFARRPFSWGLVGTVLGHRETRLATFGYLGHMWELYAMWTWIPAFLAASATARGQGRWLVDVLSFGAIATGALGCVWGGWYADRTSRERTVMIALLASGFCAVTIGFALDRGPFVLAIMTGIWGFFVVADSAQFSALVTEVAPPHAVGTALTLQTSLGFLLTLVTIQLVPVIAGTAGWTWAFPLLVLGPVTGLAAIRRLARLRGVDPFRARHRVHRPADPG